MLPYYRSREKSAHDVRSFSHALHRSGRNQLNFSYLISELIADFDPKKPTFRPTEIYNEGWLLKALLYQLSKFQQSGSPIPFAPGATWFSEALLPTAFAARYQRDPRSESRTNADGVVGHFSIGDKAKADLALHSNADQFVVIEAKINSPLSPGTKNAPAFDQAARNVACMAEVLRRANRAPTKINHLAFIVLAPQSAIEAGQFDDAMDLLSLKAKVAERVAMYESELDQWYQDWFTPTMLAIELQKLSWENTITRIGAIDRVAGESLAAFYKACLTFN